MSSVNCFGCQHWPLLHPHVLVLNTLSPLRQVIDIKQVNKKTKEQFPEVSEQHWLFRIAMGWVSSFADKQKVLMGNTARVSKLKCQFTRPYFYPVLEIWPCELKGFRGSGINRHHTTFLFWSPPSCISLLCRKHWQIFLWRSWACSSFLSPQQQSPETEVLSCPNFLNANRT